MSKSNEDLRYEVGFSSNSGLVKELNEDNYCSEMREDSEGRNLALLSVSDGYGGFSLGEIASKIAINHTEKFFKLGEFDQMYDEAEVLEPQRVIQELFTRINHVILSLAEKESRQVGCTLVSGFFRDSSVYIAAAGNSRAYLIRGGGIKKINEERTDPIARVKLDQLISEEALNVKTKEIYQNSLGSDITLRADIHHLKTQDGDIFLFCSDGLYTQIDDMDIVHTAAETPTMQAFCSSLVEKANAAGGKDNITVVALRVSKTKKTLRSILSGRKKGENFLTNPIFIAVILLAVLLLMGTFLIAKKFVSDKGGKKQNETDSSGAPIRRRSLNSLIMETEIPVKYISVNDVNKKMETETETFDLEGDNNTMKIVPDLTKMEAKRKLYSFLLSGLKRNLAVIQARQNMIIVDEDQVLVHLTYGSRIDYVTREERTGERFILKVNNLGSPMTLVMKSEEELQAKLEVDHDAQKISAPIPEVKPSKPGKKKPIPTKKPKPVKTEIRPLQPGEEGRM